MVLKGQYNLPVWMLDPPKIWIQDFGSVYYKDRGSLQNSGPVPGSDYKLSKSLGVFGALDLGWSFWLVKRKGCKPIASVEIDVMSRPPLSPPGCHCLQL